MADSVSGSVGYVSIEGVLAARRVVYRHLKPTPLYHYLLLSEALGCEAYVKHENHLPTGSFKVRGGINLVSSLTAEDKARGIITATRGNHGQSLAFASREYGVRAVIVVPEGNNPEKNAAMRAYGAELIVHGRDFDEAREKAEELTRANGYRYVHPANEPLLIHGVGTYALEIMEELPEVDVIINPIGGGSGVAGILTVVRALKPAVEVIGVQAEGAPAVYLSWREGKFVTTESATTFADGVATRVPFELTFDIIRRQIDDIVLVSEDEIRQAVLTLLRTTHNLAEGAGALAVAGAFRLRERLRGKRVVTVLTGGNIDQATLRRILTDSGR